MDTNHPQHFLDHKTHPALPPGPDGNPAEISERVFAEVVGTKSDILELAGTEMEQHEQEETIESPESKEESAQVKNRVQFDESTTSKKEPTLKAMHAQIEVAHVIHSIENLAGRLRDENMEYRLSDVWEHIPIVANVRSHRAATREAVLIDDMNEEVRELQRIINSAGLDIPVGPVVEALGYISKSEGASKWFGTLVPTMRVLHRNLTVPRIEKLEEEIGNVRKALRAQAALN